MDIPEASNASDLDTLSSRSNTARAAAAASSGSPSETASCSISKGVDAVSSSLLLSFDVVLPYAVRLAGGEAYANPPALRIACFGRKIKFGVRPGVQRRGEELGLMIKMKMGKNRDGRNHMSYGGGTAHGVAGVSETGQHKTNARWLKKKRHGPDSQF